MLRCNEHCPRRAAMQVGQRPIAVQRLPIPWAPPPIGAAARVGAAQLRLDRRAAARRSLREIGGVLPRPARPGRQSAASSASILLVVARRTRRRAASISAASWPSAASACLPGAHRAVEDLAHAVRRPGRVQLVDMVPVAGPGDDRHVRVRPADVARDLAASAPGRRWRAPPPCASAIPAASSSSGRSTSP